MLESREQATEDAEDVGPLLDGLRIDEQIALKLPLVGVPTRAKRSDFRRLPHSV